MLRKKLTKFLGLSLAMLTLLLVVCFVAPHEAKAATYPSIFAKEIDQEACIGTYLAMEYTYFPAYKNEKIIVNVYDPDGQRIATSERSTTNLTIKEIKYTSHWDTADCEPGRYKIVVSMKYYSFMEWRDKPTTTTSWVTLKEHTHEANVSTTATTKRAGTVTYTCSSCGNKYTEAVAKISKISLAGKSFAYNGKAQKPAVTVKDTEGNLLTEGTDYTVKYASGRKKVGTYSVTVKFKGKYSGEKKLSFAINPKPVVLKSVTKGVNQITVKWKKNTAETSGYQIMCATNKKFTQGKVTKNVTSAKTTSLKVAKLKGDKEYFVKIRSYKTVNGKKLYSEWSDYETVFVLSKNSPKISAEKKTLYSGATYTLKLTTQKGAAINTSNLKFSSNNKSVASVNSAGVITAKKPGTATITVKYKGVSYKCAITVESRLKLSKSDWSVYKDEPFTVKITKDNTASNISVKVVGDSGIVGWTWGKWSNGTISMNITPKAVGTTQIKVTHNGTGSSYDYKYINITVNPDWTVECKQKTPLQVGDYSTYREEYYTKGTINSMEITQEETYSGSGKILINFTGTLDYQREDWTSDLNFKYRIMDEEGFIVESGTVFTDADVVGAKFKETETIYIDDPKGNYIIEFYD